MTEHAALKDERKATAKLLMRYLSMAENRKALTQIGVTNSTPIIACEWETPVSEVNAMLAHQEYAEHVLVAVRQGDEIRALTATLSDSNRDKGDAISLHDVGGTSDIGMVIQALTSKKLMINLPPASQLFPGFGLSSPRLGNYDLAVV